MLQYLKLFLKVANHAALLLPQVKQTEQQRKRVSHTGMVNEYGPAIE